MRFNEYFLFIAVCAGQKERRQLMYGPPGPPGPPGYYQPGQPVYQPGPMYPPQYQPAYPAPPGYQGNPGYEGDPRESQCQGGWQGPAVLSQIEQLSGQVNNVANDVFSIAENLHSIVGLLTMPLQIVHAGVEAVQMVGSVAGDVMSLHCADQGLLSTARGLFSMLFSSYSKLKSSVETLSDFGGAVSQLSVFHDLMSGLEGLFSDFGSLLGGITHLGHGSDTTTKDSWENSDPYAATNDPYAATSDPYAATSDPVAIPSTTDDGWDTVYITSTVALHHSHTRTIVTLVTATGRAKSESSSLGAQRHSTHLSGQPKAHTTDRTSSMAEHQSPSSMAHHASGSVERR